MAENEITTPVAQEETTAPEARPERTERYDRQDRGDRGDRQAQNMRVGATDLLPELKTSGEEAPTKEVANGRAYEITYIVVANNPTAVEETQAGVKTLIEGVDGAIDNARVSEVRRLAYPIDKKTEGVYVVINARFNKSVTDELTRFFKLDERVLRHIILREGE